MQTLKQTTDGQKVVLEGAEGTLELTVLTPEIVRVFQDRGRHTNSYAIEGDKMQPTQFSTTDEGDHITLKTDALTVQVDASFHIDVFDEASNPLIISHQEGRSETINKTLDAGHASIVRAEGHEVSSVNSEDSSYYEIVNALDTDEHFYGLGDKTGFLDKRGYEYDNWNYDEPRPHIESFTNLYKSIPVLLGLKQGHAYGLFFDNTYRSHFDLGKENDRYYFYSAADGNLDYYIMGGKDLKAVVSNYTYLTGRTPLPQRWMLGYQQSRWGYSMSQEIVESIVDKFHEYHLPLEAVHFDIDYMDGYRVFTWDTDKFKDPKGFLTSLKNRGVRVIPILDPGVKQDDDYEIYQEGVKNGYFATDPKTGEIYINRVWPGKSAFPSFGDKEVRDWWGRHCKFLLDTGAAGIWTDMNEPATFDGDMPEDVVMGDEGQKSDLKRMNNVYGHNMAKATYEGIRKASDRRPFVITRAAYAGTQKYSAIWTGDNQSLWHHLQMSIPQLSNMGLSGFSYLGADIGGFSADCTPELLTRWIEAAIFSPMLRNHAALQVRDQEPWVFGKAVLDNYRDYLHLRYRFIPYLYDCFATETQNGLPVMRPLVLNYPGDVRVRTCNDEYMVGDKVLVAPVVTQGQRSRAVWLPEGEWIDYWTGERHDGGRDILVDAPLDKLPLFIKADSLLPVGPVVEHLSDEPDESMTFRLFGDKGEYDHYQDDGYSFGYEKGEYNVYHVVADGDASSVTLRHHGFKPVYRQVTLELPEGELTFDWDAADGTYSVRR